MGFATAAMGGAGMASSLAGGIIGAEGAEFSGSAQSAAALYQAQVARNNAIIAGENANLVSQQGTVAVQNQQQKTAQGIGNLTAMQGASGTMVNSGSNVNVRSSAAEVGELDALTIRYNANLQARNDIIGAQSQQANAGLLQAQAGWDKTAANYNAMSSILGSASNVSGKWLSMQQAGVFSGMS